VTEPLYWLSPARLTPRISMFRSGLLALSWARTASRYPNWVLQEPQLAEPKKKPDTWRM